MEKKFGRIFIFVLQIFFVSNIVFAFEDKVPDLKVQESKYEKLYSLLAGYLENNLDLQKSALTARSKLLDYDLTKINNGIDLSLSSGSVKIQKTSDGTKCTFSPSATLSIPQLNDSELTASAPFTMKSDFEKDNGTFVDGASVKLTAGIITSEPLKRKISLLEAERAYTEAIRDVKNCALSAEKEFYENLKKLYKYASEVLEKKNSLYDDEVDLRVLTAQGYSKTSASYRQKNLDVQSDKRDVHEAERKLERETAIFAIKCGVEYERIFENNTSGKKNGDSSGAGDAAFEAVVNFLPSEIPDVEMVDVLDFSPEDYSKTESAEWNKYIGELKRKTDYKMELKGYGGYTFNESSSSYDTVDGGLTFSWKGIAATAGVSVPTGKNVLPFDSTNSSEPSKNPVYTFSLSIKPSSWRLAKIDKKQDLIESEIDDIEVKGASDEYETDVLEKLTSCGDLMWSQKSYLEEYDMYSSLADEMKKWLEQGIVKESDYLDAVNNREKARINLMMNGVEKIIYNNEVKLLFVEKSDVNSNAK